MSIDYATLARIEDHLRRLTDASERIATALERVPAVTVGEFDLAGCDDRTCANRDHWAPTGRINHGSTPTTCTHGQDHSDDLECEYHDKPLPDGEFHVSSLETGKPVRVTVTNRQTGSTLFDGDVAEMPAGLDLPQGGWSADDLVQPAEPDPLDESDHRPRHDRYDQHWEQAGKWWVASRGHSDGSWLLDELVRFRGPLTFCYCPDDATIEAENGATD